MSGASTNVTRRFHPVSLALALLLVSLLASFTPGTRVEAAQPRLASAGTLPLAFEPNVGQTDASVRFLVHAPRAVLHFTPGELVLMLAEPTAAAGGASRHDPDRVTAQPAVPPRAVRMSFIGANQAAQVTGEAPLPGVVNYLLESDPARWHTQVPTYGELVYHELYPGIDLSYGGQAGLLKGTYLVAPGSDPGQIRWRYQGGDRVSLTAAGALQVQVGPIAVTEHTPVAWQEPAGGRVGVPVAYNLAADGSVSFQVGAYDQTLPLLIDPTLSYSTFLGGTAGDEARAIAVDAAGNMYVTGSTASTDFPVVNPIQNSNHGFDDVFVTKLNASGSAVLFSTYLGGTKDDVGWDVTLDGNANIYLTGRTSSSAFPTTPGAFRTSRSGDTDAFVTKLPNDGASLVYSTYLGGATCANTGSATEWGFAIAVDSANQAYVAGLTLCSDFPTTGSAYQTTAGGVEDAFLTKLAADGGSLLYSTFLGGNALEWAEAMAIDGSGNAYLVGRTHSTNFPLKNPYQATKSDSADLFVAKVNTTASGDASLVYATYLGGPGEEKGYGIAVDTLGYAYVAGMTRADGFPTTSGAVQTSFGGGGVCADGDEAGDGVVAKLNPSGSGLIYSTYLGGTGCDAVRSIAVDGSGAAYMAGWTDSGDFPLASPIQASLGGGTDAFVSQLNATGSSLLFSTYLGGGGHDYARNVALDSAGVLYVVGQAQSSDFPTSNALYSSAGGGDAFIAKISGLTSPPVEVAPLPKVWYFAEGFTASGFDEYLTIQNPGAAGTATITYYLEGGSPPEVRSINLAANSRTTVAVHAPASAGNPGGLGRLNVGHSTKVEASVPVVVERPMYFTYGGTVTGGHNVMGANSAAAAWYFAEGFTAAGFDEYLTIQNPGAAGTATITYYLEGGSPPETRSVPLAANSRTTVAVHAPASAANPGGLGRLNVGHSTKVEADVPVVVERPMYFTYAGSVTDGHNVLGASGPASAWYFAEGFTAAGFDEYLTIQNPGAAGTATITYYLEGGSPPETRSVPLAANSRTTVAVHAPASAANPGGLGRLNVGHSTKVEADVPVVVERPMYFTYGGSIDGGHNVLGAGSAAAAWYFAEGFTAPGFDEYLTIQNPGAAGTATITYYLEDGSAPVERSVPLAANSRTTVAVHAPESAGNPGGLGRLNVGHSTKVEADVPVVVERPMYFTYGDTLTGGHDVLGFAP